MTTGAGRHRSGARRAPRARPRYGRLAALSTALVVTLVTVAGGVGLLSTGNRPTANAVTQVPDRPSALSLSAGTTAVSGTIDPTMLADHTGTGRRVVFDQSAQRVWLVRGNGEVARTYLVSGSVTDNLKPGRYSVYSRSRWAVGVDDSGVMQYFVRFAHGEKAAIGFHTIPTKNGTPLQTRKQLGTPQSHGCIRQALPDALAMWDFARIGTRVVVVP